MRTDWTRDEIAALFDLPFTELVFRAADGPPRASRRGRGAALHPAVDQDRRLPGGLRLLLAVGQRRHRAEGDQADGRARGAAGGGAGEGRRARSASAWARRGATPRTATCPRSSRWSKGVRADGAGDLHDAGHADAAIRREQLAEAGLDYYNHNIDTSPENYGEVITTRTFEDRLDTLENVREAGINVCCGGIVGMGETRERPRRLRPRARDAAAPSRKRAGQRAGAGQGHGAGRHARRHAAGEDRRHRVRPHGRGRADHDAAEHGAAVARAARA